MTSVPRGLARAGGVALGAALTLSSLTACNEEQSPVESASVVVGDVSKSGEAVELRQIATSMAVAQVESMPVNSTVRFLAFSMEVGSSKCQPVRVGLPFSDNSQETDDARQSYAGQLPTVIEAYIDCTIESYDGVGTDVFGSIAEAAELTSDVDGDRTISVVTDGCQFTPSLKLCRPAVADEKWQTTAVDDLPASLKPDLSGVRLEISGLGMGSHLQAEEVAGLRAVYLNYATTTGADLTFVN